ncbi:MAG: dephospho-CoA kinase [Bacteroidales bacterium]|nr:dephospho-CoA kinase [Bacteroidales bacterium]
MKTIAVTGGIGSGKSTVCGILLGRGIPVYDTDSAAKALYDKDPDLLDSVEEAFGCGLRLPDGSFDRSKLASIVFSSQDKLRTLEGIIHPAVLKDFIRWNAMQDARFEGSGPSEVFYGKAPFCVIESAIILEKPEFLSRVDKVVYVDASLQNRLKRACSRDGVEPEQVIKRMAMQRFDLSKVDVILRNDGTMEELEAELSRVFRI